MTLKTGSQNTATMNEVIPTISYGILNRFSLNGRFRLAVFVALEYLLGTASDDMLSRFNRIPA